MTDREAIRLTALVRAAVSLALAQRMSIAHLDLDRPNTNEPTDARDGIMPASGGEACVADAAAFAPPRRACAGHGGTRARAPVVSLRAGSIGDLRGVLPWPNGPAFVHAPLKRSFTSPSTSMCSKRS